MSLRARGRGTHAVRGRPRGSTNKKSTLWTYRVYSPEPEVYESLHRVRRAPPTISHAPADECPIPNAQTRILTRRQTDDGLCRQYYRVEIRRLASPHPEDVKGARGLSTAEEVGEDEAVEEVDISRILRYVSARELERFENADFRAEAEAEAIAKRAAMDELVQRRMEKNARGLTATSGGSMTALGLGVARRGRPPKRSWYRGRGRGAYANVGRREGAMNPQEDAAEDDEMLQLDGQEDLERVIDETEDEDEDEDEPQNPLLHPSSPNLGRSSFVLGSALADSPTLLSRKLVAPSELDDSSDEDASSMSSAAQQLMTERRHHGNQLPKQDSDSDPDPRGRDPTKRRKTESTSSSRPAPTPRKPTTTHPKPLVIINPAHRVPPPQSTSTSSSQDSDSDTDSQSLVDEIPESLDPLTGPLSTPPRASDDAGNVERDGGDEDEDEVAISAILAHSLDDGKKYYLVKWAGYADAEDWVVESDLAGAGDMVDEYEERVRRRKK